MKHKSFQDTQAYSEFIKRGQRFAIVRTNEEAVEQLFKMMHQIKNKKWITKISIEEKYGDRVGDCQYVELSGLRFKEVMEKIGSILNSFFDEEEEDQSNE